MLEILFEDNHCIAVAKPAPLLTQAPPGVPSLEALVKSYLKEKHRKPGNVYLGVPHRLDRPVSGVVLFARNSKAAARLAEQFHKRQVTKVYWGLVEGQLHEDEGTSSHAAPPHHPATHVAGSGTGCVSCRVGGTWEDWLVKVQAESRAESATESTPGARHCRLRYRVLERLPIATLVEFLPETGRMHQIRVQTALRGHPILGDALYGATQPFGPPAQSPRDRVIALHGRSLTFLHPLSYQPTTVTAPLPAAFGDLSTVR